MKISDIQKMDIICNIHQMQKIIGISIDSFEYLMEKTYNELFDIQNSLISHYNEAIKNKA